MRTSAGTPWAATRPKRSVLSLRAMAYVIAGNCIKDDVCIEVCPVDCIHPKPGDPDFETAEQLYIHPDICIDCDACVEACPVDAIFAETEIPEKYDYALTLNQQFFLQRAELHQVQS
jgi:ferredoxin